MTTNTQAQKEMKQAVVGLLMGGQEFFASLILRLPLIEDTTIETACTNGQCIKYNPEYILKLSGAAQRALLCHEVMHCANGHVWRREGREPLRWNMACDYAINPIISKTNGLTLPPGGLLDAAFDGMSAEQIYRELPPQEGDGKGKQPGAGGMDVQDSEPDPQGNEMTEQDWQQAVMQAVKDAEKRGNAPAGFDRLLNKIKYPACRDLVAALLEFCNRSAREDYSFRRPARRHIAHGLVMPELYSVTCPPIVGCVDTSGSVYDELLSDYRGALQRVLDECRPETLSVVSCDAQVHRVDEYAEGDIVRAEFPGGGGTDFCPALERAAGYEPTACIYLTDLYGDFPDTPPTFPTLWCVFDKNGSRQKAPFGETLWLE